MGFPRRRSPHALTNSAAPRAHALRPRRADLRKLIRTKRADVAVELPSLNFQTQGYFEAKLSSPFCGVAPRPCCQRKWRDMVRDPRLGNLPLPDRFGAMGFDLRDSDSSDLLARTFRNDWRKNPGPVPASWSATRLKHKEHQGLDPPIRRRPLLGNVEIALGTDEVQTQHSGNLGNVPNNLAAPRYFYPAGMARLKRPCQPETFASGRRFWSGFQSGIRVAAMDLRRHRHSHTCWHRSARRLLRVAISRCHQRETRRARRDKSR